MKIYNGILACVLSAPIAVVGCGVQEQTSKAISQQDNNNADYEFFNGGDRLETYRHVISGIHFFDVDGNQILDKKETRRLFVVHVLGDHTWPVTQSAVANFKELEDTFRSASMTKTTQGRMYAENIGQTLRNFKLFREELQKQVHDSQDEQIKRSLEKLFPETAKK